MDDDVTAQAKEGICPACLGPIAIRNPTGTCDHLYWPEYLTPEAQELVRDIEAAKAQLEDYRINGGVSLDGLKAELGLLDEPRGSSASERPSSREAVNPNPEKE